MRLAVLALSSLLPWAAAPAEPTAPPAAAEPVLAAPPTLRRPPQVEVPPGTVFPAPEVVVVLGIDVSAGGAVEAVRVEQGAGAPFDEAAVAAARALEFEPGRLTTGEAVPVAITFQLRIPAPPPAAVAPPPPRPVRLLGRLLERGTRKPLPDVAVAAQVEAEVLARATSEADGRFALEVPAAAFRLVAVPPGHERLDVEVQARPGEERDEIYYLAAEASEYVSVVRGERIRREITRQVLPREEVALVPGTQGDTLKAVLNFPGAARPSFGGGNLVLRGSSPGDSAVFIDGLQIPQLYHFGGLRSTFAPRFLDSLEFVPGNFAADYGRLTGGVVNVRVRDPERDLLRGEADFNLYDAGVAVEGPLSEGWSGGAAFRRSWVDAILPLVLPKDAPLSFTTAPRFYDYQFLASWKPDEVDKIRLLFFGSQDKLVAILERPAGDDPALTGNLRTRVSFHNLQASWTRVLSPVLRQESWVAAGLRSLRFDVGPELFFDLSTRNLDARTTWSWQAREGVELRGGLDLQYGWADISLNLPRPPQEGTESPPVSTGPRIATRQTASIFQPAAFAELRAVPLPGLALVPSLRIDHDTATGRTSLDPRLGARYALVPGTVLKAALGVYQQPPDPAESARQVGTPDLLPKRSVQASAGLERRLAEGVDLDLTAFGKRLDRLVVRNEAQAVDPDLPRYVNDGVGRVYGLELLLRARFGERFFGWIAYTFQRSLRTDHPGDPERRFDFDQPHILTALGTWKLNPRWALGARFRLVSGNPYTPVTGSIYDAGADVFVPTYGASNAGRQGTFHALDLRADRFWTFDRWRLSAYLDVQNAYNRGNQEGWQYSYDFRQRTPLTGLPLLPIFGVKGEW